MPKEGKAGSLSSNSSRVSPYPLRSSRKTKQTEQASPVESEGPKLWDETRCPICIEPPHNAVLLKCSSFSNGCRPYMCDTTSRHSNCFKQFRKNNNNNRIDPKTLCCPLCRGTVYGTMIIRGARRFMNAKPRSCPSEDCSFTGTYHKLNHHVKTVHPDINPTKVDPSRQSDWQNMERESDYTDMLSTMRFSLVHEHEQQEGEGNNANANANANASYANRIPATYVNSSYGVRSGIPILPNTYTPFESSLGGLLMDEFLASPLLGGMTSRLGVSHLSGHWEYHATVYTSWP